MVANKNSTRSQQHIPFNLMPVFALSLCLSDNVNCINGWKERKANCFDVDVERDSNTIINRFLGTIFSSFSLYLQEDGERHNENDFKGTGLDTS